MKILNFSLIGIVILGILTGCTPVANSTLTPDMTASKLILKVGETATITMTAPTIAITGGNTNLTMVDTGFIYSPNPNQTAPYLLDTNASLSGPGPEIFPIALQLEVVLPVTGSDNVPPRVSVVKEGDLSKATFVVKGKSVGTALIRGGFLGSTVEDPTKFRRTPFVPNYDGTLTIQVVP
jgi:hypothetical protein